MSSGKVFSLSSLPAHFVHYTTMRETVSYVVFSFLQILIITCSKAVFNFNFNFIYFTKYQELAHLEGWHCGVSI